MHQQSWSPLLYGNICSIKNVLDVSLNGKPQDRNGLLGQISYLRSSQATANLKFSVELKCNRWLCFISPSMKVRFVLFPSHRCFVEICHCLQWVSSGQQLPNESTHLALGPRCECCPPGLCDNRILNHGRQPSPANWSDRHLEPPTARETSGWARAGVQTLRLFNMRAASRPACLSPLLLCLCVLQRSYGTPSPPSPTFTHNQTKLPDGDKDSHHRPKRGWIWNQFFVLEEHIGPDAQYVGKVWAFFCFDPCAGAGNVLKLLRWLSETNFIWFIEQTVPWKSTVLTSDIGYASCFWTIIAMSVYSCNHVFLEGSK